MLEEADTVVDGSGEVAIGDQEMAAMAEEES